MARPLSNSQINKLGVRLVERDPPSADDLELLHVLLASYSEALATAVAKVGTALGLVPSARVKNTGTIIEKLARSGGSSSSRFRTWRGCG
jgi:hypothetical protein